MASITLKSVEKWFGAVQVIKGVDLSIEEGEFVIFVGPSGCGKSTLLRMIAGLEETSRGQIMIGDRDVSKLEPKERDLAMVFQDYALYPHMNVAKNMSFALRLARMNKSDIEKRVKEVAATLDLTAYLDRKPAELSGGQRQRVAMGRALVRDAGTFLFDEPLSNLDAKLRGQMRAELALMSQRIKKNMIYVTHDQVEAMTLADRIVVMNDGRIEQVGTPMELFNNPANTFVAGFLGSPPMNQIKGILTETGARIGNTEIKLHGAINGHAGRDVIVGIRPEHVTLGQTDGTSSLPIELDLVEPLGSEALLHARYGDENMVFKADTNGDITHLSGVAEVHVPAHLVKLFDAETGRALSLGA